MCAYSPRCVSLCLCHLFALHVSAGYREKTETDAAGTTARAEIVLCELGTYSAWSGTGTRDPGTSTDCTPCTLNTYAPRKGMQKCLACKAGTYPTTSTSNGALGPDQCTVCDAFKYRPAFLTSAQCDICPPGSETGPSNHAACTPW